MRTLLDTNVFIRWALDERLPHFITRLLQKASTECHVSIVTPWEIALLNAHGRIDMPAKRVETVIKDLGARVLPITMSHTAALYMLPPHHHDPFDRMLIAQASVEDLPIVTADQRFALYRGLRVIW